MHVDNDALLSLGMRRFSVDQIGASTNLVMSSTDHEMSSTLREDLFISLMDVLCLDMRKISYECDKVDALRVIRDLQDKAAWFLSDEVS